jgi:hypothetical protein
VVSHQLIKVSRQKPESAQNDSHLRPALPELLDDALHLLERPGTRSENIILLGHDEGNTWVDPILQKLPLRMAITSIESRAGS